MEFKLANCFLQCGFAILLQVVHWVYLLQYLCHNEGDRRGQIKPALYPRLAITSILLLLAFALSPCRQNIERARLHALQNWGKSAKMAGATRLHVLQNWGKERKDGGCYKKIYCPWDSPPSLECVRKCLIRLFTFSRSWHPLCDSDQFTASR